MVKIAKITVAILVIVLSELLLTFGGVLQSNSLSCVTQVARDGNMDACPSLSKILVIIQGATIGGAIIIGLFASLKPEIVLVAGFCIVLLENIIPDFVLLFLQVQNDLGTFFASVTIGTIFVLAIFSVFDYWRSSST